ncbi:MAG: agmatinase [Pseudomonadota bacterium]
MTKVIFDEAAISGFLHANTRGTFMRRPEMACEAAALREAGIDCAVLGFPWDAMCISRTGTNLGPKAIRAASEQFSLYNANLDLDLSDVFTIADVGDVPVVPGGATRTMAEAEALVGEILSAGAIPITLGGDHSINIACTRAFAKAHAKPGLILVDSHFDTALEVGGEDLSHCCPIPRAIDAGFDPKNIAIVGTNGWMNPKDEFAFVRDHGIALFPIEQVVEEGPVAVGEKARKIAADGTDAVYLTFDIDSIDAAYAPGTGVPAIGGMTSREAIALITTLAKGGLGGMDLVEVSPSFDHDGVTSRLAVHLILDALGAMAAGR